MAVAAATTAAAAAEGARSVCRKAPHVRRMDLLCALDIVALPPHRRGCSGRRGAAEFYSCSAGETLPRSTTLDERLQASEVGIRGSRSLFRVLRQVADAWLWSCDGAGDGI